LVTKAIPAKTSQTFRERLQISEETGNMLTDTYYRIGGFVREDLGLQFQANIVDGKGQRVRSDTEVRNFIVDGEYYLNANNDFKAQLQYYEVKAELPGALSPTAYEQNPNQSRRTLFQRQPHTGEQFLADSFRSGNHRFLNQGCNNRLLAREVLVE